MTFGAWRDRVLAVLIGAWAAIAAYGVIIYAERALQTPLGFADTQAAGVAAIVAALAYARLRRTQGDPQWWRWVDPVVVGMMVAPPVATMSASIYVLLLPGFSLPPFDVLARSTAFLIVPAIACSLLTSVALLLVRRPMKGREAPVGECPSVADGSALEERCAS